MKAPGKFYREGISFVELIKMFPDNDKSREWFESRRWKDGAYCPHCGSLNVQCNVKHPTQTHRCRDCSNKPFFSVKTGTIMHKSNLDYQTWAIAIYMFTTNLKGVSSMKLHRELEITQKSAWLLVSKLRKAYEVKDSKLKGIVEVDETYMGGKEANKHESKKLKAGRGTVGKTAVFGMKERESGRIVARVIADTKKETLQGLVRENTEEGTEIHSDENQSYKGLENHKTVNHSIGEYVKGNVHTNGIESMWAMFKRGHKGTYHKMSPKHLHRYVAEFVGRHNHRKSDTIDQMTDLVIGMNDKRLTYNQLVGSNA
ncbi:MAG: IS1595 family transposase [Rhodobacteraceae bacterium]|nr:IS1595 family transposase [Paracoccaceae bacterium]MYK43874.1 IS1595 family transposase [Gammaproteobacteria bacterium]